MAVYDAGCAYAIACNNYSIENTAMTAQELLRTAGALMNAALAILPDKAAVDALMLQLNKEYDAILVHRAQMRAANIIQRSDYWLDVLPLGMRDSLQRFESGLKPVVIR